MYQENLYLVDNGENSETAKSFDKLWYSHIVGYYAATKTNKHIYVENWKIFIIYYY